MKSIRRTTEVTAKTVELVFQQIICHNNTNNDRGSEHCDLDSLAVRAQKKKARASTVRAISDLAHGRRPDSYDDPRAAAEASALIGTPEEVIEKLRMMEQGGVAHVLLIDITGSREALRLFADEVMPAFSESALQPANA